MKKRNITKSPAVLEDFARGIGTVTQNRAGTEYTVHLVDVPAAVSSEAELSALDVTKFQYARVYVAVNQAVEYNYDPNSTSGLPSTGLGTWVPSVGNAGTIYQLSTDPFPATEGLVKGTRLIHSDTYDSWTLQPLDDGTLGWVENGNVGDELPLGTTVRGSDIDIVYNDASKASENFQKIVQCANDLTTHLILEDNLYLTASETLVTGGLHITMLNDGVITWTDVVGVQKVFKMRSGTYWEETDVKHLLENGSLHYMSYENNDGYIPHLEFIRPEFDGDFYFKFDSDNTLNPGNNKFGFGRVKFDEFKLRNRVTNFWTAQSLPYDSVTFVRPDVYNWGANIISAPVDNNHPYYEDIKKAMKVMYVGGGKADNPDDKLGESNDWAFASFYHTFVLWEGDTLYYMNMEVSNMKTLSGIPCYDFYAGGNNLYTDNTTCTDIYAFQRANNIEPVTCLKVKAADRVECDHRSWNYTDTWFSRIDALFNVDADSSDGEWITYSGSTNTTRFNVTNSEFYLPKLNWRTIPSRLVQDINYNNVTFESPDDGIFNLFPVVWDSSNAVANRKLRMTGCRIYAKRATGTLVDLVIGDSRGGMSVNVTDNVIIAKDLNEVFIRRQAPFDISTLNMEDLRVNNNIAVTGVYNKFVSDNRSPAVISMDVGGTITCDAFSGNSLNLPLMPTGSGAATGKLTQTWRSGQPVVNLVNFLKPEITSTNTKYYTIRGEIIDINKVHPFAIAFQITGFNNTSITIDYTRNDNTAQSFTWSGAGSDLGVAVNSTHPTLSAKFTRTSTNMRLVLDVGASGRVELDTAVSIL